jgi:hypothetical protein
MRRPLNALHWDGRPGHYEVYYLSATDRGSGVGLWIRYTLLAPLEERGEPTCSLWLMAMDPAATGAPFARKQSFPISALSAQEQPFALRVGDAELTDRGMRGTMGDARWELEWQPSRAYEHVHPLLQRARVAKTVLTLPHADLEVHGTVSVGGRTLELHGARGGQAHLWGSKHASRWAWAHCNDLETDTGEPRGGAFLDGVSVIVPRFGRELGPSTPVVARFAGRDLLSTSPRAVLANPSTFALTSWRFAARGAERRALVEVDARREDLVGVTYEDPDGEQAYCYNTEIATMRVLIQQRVDGRWEHLERLVAPRRAHFEYAQREPVPGLELHVT